MASRGKPLGWRDPLWSGSLSILNGRQGFGGRPPRQPRQSTCGYGQAIEDVLHGGAREPTGRLQCCEEAQVTINKYLTFYI